MTTLTFRALFMHAVPERKVFEISNLSAEMMQLIINFAYTGSVSVTEDNVQQLFEAADQFLVTGIVQACCSFLEKNLTSENCIGIWQFTNFCFGPELRETAFYYILHNFNEVMYTQEFLQLSGEELQYILDRDDLNVVKEKSVCEAILRWIDVNPEERNKYFAGLLSKVRLALTSLRYIRTLMSSSAVRRDVECAKVVRHARKIKLQMGKESPTLLFCSNHMGRPRLPSAILFACGSLPGRNLANVTEVYDMRINSWTNVTIPQETPFCYHSTVFYNGFIYWVGGFNGEKSNNSVYRFDVKNHTFLEVGPMHHCRCFLSAAVLDGYIYAIGGRDGTERLKTAERYSPKTNQWSFIASMHDRRSDAGCAVLHNRIYICGGSDGHQFHRHCEYYCPDMNLWTWFTSMNLRRSGLSIVAYEDQIFAVGGFSGSVCIRSVEAYNPHDDAWHEKPDTLFPHSGSGIGVIDNKIIVVGGFNGTETSNKAEYYDLNTHRWHEACQMKNSCTVLSCCVVPGIPNIAEYTISRDTLPLLKVL
ncbi:kelch-like protein 10 [Antennarius striatus]|uniref:kelch-like protein 10 n=1 Tax=Antennarius striatus TaxID=241820 RepID=UPI0035B3D929